MNHLSRWSVQDAENVFVRILENADVKLGLSVASILGEWLFGGHKEALAVVFVLIVIDTFSGTLKAAKKHKLSSAEFFQFAVKIMVYFAMMLTSSLVDKSLPIALASPIIYTFLAVTEAISILENIGESGYPVPNSLINRLKVMSDKEDHKEDKVKVRNPRGK